MAERDYPKPVTWKVVILALLITAPFLGLLQIVIALGGVLFFADILNSGVKCPGAQGLLMWLAMSIFLQILILTLPAWVAAKFTHANLNSIWTITQIAGLVVLTVVAILLFAPACSLF